MIWMLNFVIATLLLSNIISSQAATREFNAGDEYLWGIANNYSLTHTDLNESVSYITEISLAGDAKYKIIEVDTLAKTIEANITDPSGKYTEKDIPYDVTTFGDVNLNLFNVIDVAYAYDYDTNSCVLYDFNFFIDFRLFMEPNWATVNNDMKAMFNESEIITQVADPWAPIETNKSLIYNVTLGHLFGNSTSFTIMNVKNNLANAKTKFTSVTRSWNFKFDFSDVLHFRLKNKPDGNYTYYPTEIATLSLSAFYTEGGVVERILYNSQLKQTLPGIIDDIVIDNEIALGGLRSVTGNFSFFAFIPVVIIVGSIIPIKRRRK